MPRDPKLDPQAGDIVSVDPTGRLVRFVSYRHPNRVMFASRLGNQWFNSTFKETLKEWQRAVASGIVFQKAVDSFSYEGDDAEASIAGTAEVGAGTSTAKAPAPKKKRSASGMASARKARRQPNR